MSELQHLRAVELEDALFTANARIAELEATLAQVSRVYHDNQWEQLQNAKARIAELEAAVLAEREALVECIRSTTWSGTEEIVAMIRARPAP